jgi:hypothetical protein
MPTQPRTPSDHYQEASRLLAAAESPTVDPGLRDLSARLALAHAVLTLAPRKARRVPAPPGRHTGGSPTERWLRGDEQEGGES